MQVHVQVQVRGRDKNVARNLCIQTPALNHFARNSRSGVLRPKKNWAPTLISGRSVPFTTHYSPLSAHPAGVRPAPQLPSFSPVHHHTACQDIGLYNTPGLRTRQATRYSPPRDIQIPNPFLGPQQRLGATVWNCPSTCSFDPAVSPRTAIQNVQVAQTTTFIGGSA